MCSARSREPSPTLYRMRWESTRKCECCVDKYVEGGGRGTFVAIIPVFAWKIRCKPLKPLLGNLVPRQGFETDIF
jgi:hypothetical protein